MSDSREVVSGLRILGFRYPNPQMPYYHVRCKVKVAEPIMVTGSSFGLAGGKMRKGEVQPVVNGEKTHEGVVPAEVEAEMLIRCDWQAGKTYRVQLDWKPKGANDPGKPVSTSDRSPAKGGYWDARWKNYRPIVLREKDGLKRELEPVDVSFAVPWFDRPTTDDLAREIRVMEVNTRTGACTEIPSQTYAVTPLAAKGDGAGEAGVRCNVAFLATVPANATKVYLAFYGNPKAAAPKYKTDLRVSGAGAGQVWENAHARYSFDAKSGQLIEVFMKGVEKTFCHGRKGGSTAMHWNPDCYSRPRPWAYTHKWNIPESGNIREIRGPIFCQTTRWGALEANMPEVESWVTYRLYAGNPELHMSSLMEVVQDIECTAIRNDEIVLNATDVTHYAFKDTNGKVTEAPKGTSEKIDRKLVGPLDLDLPWVCLYDRKDRCGLGSVHVSQDFGHRYGKLAATDKAGIYFHLNEAGICYWFRAYVMELWKPHDAVLEKGAFYSETNAYLPFKLNAGSDPLKGFSERAERLLHPLMTSAEWFV